EPALALGAEATPSGSDVLGDESAFDAEVEPSAALPPSPPASSSGGGGSGPSPMAGAGPPASAAEAPQCLVPRVGAERLAVARKKLVATDCRLGKVRGRRTRSALVVHQSPAAGKRLPAG